jgi:hypothetical protein
VAAPNKLGNHGRIGKILLAFQFRFAIVNPTSIGPELAAERPRRLFERERIKLSRSRFRNPPETGRQARRKLIPPIFDVCVTPAHLLHLREGPIETRIPLQWSSRKE